MNKFSRADGIEDKLTDSIGVLAREIRNARFRSQIYSDLRNQLFKAIKKSRYLVFTANVTNYGTWTVGQSILLYVPEGRRGALSIFQNKTIRLICIGSGRFTRLLAASAIKLEPRIFSKVIKQFELNQQHLNQQKLQNEPHLKKYLRELGIRGSNRSDGMIFIAAREKSSMSSIWTDILALQKLSDGNWQLHQGMLEIIGSIYDLGEDKIYDKNGDLAPPKSHQGKRIIGLLDNEYLLTNNFLIENSSNKFLADNYTIYRPFLLEHDWMDISIFWKIRKVCSA
jgi:hypothetical protein